MSLDEIFEALKQPIPAASRLNDRSHERLDYDWSAEYAQRGFQSEYLHSDFILDPILEELRENAEKWAPDKYKAPYTAIIGPTMIGKTRLIMELAKRLPVVYVCLRSKDSTGLPPRSKLADYIVPLNPPNDPQLHYAIVLGAILEAVTDFFRSGEVAELDSEDQVTAWYKHSFPTDAKTDTEKFAAQVKVKMDAQQNLPEKQRFIYLKQALAAYSAAYSKLCPTRDLRLKILLAIDEARSLLELKDGSTVSPFRHFRRVLSQITQGEGFFALFTDTTSRVANFCPSLQYDPSARLHNLGSDLFPPIYQLQTLDLFASKPKTLEELASPIRLLSYGNPFYGPYARVAEIGIGTVAAIRQVVMIAQTKLLLTTSVAPLSQAQIFALLGPLIQPSLYTACELNIELLSSHAAHCMYINPTRDRVVSQYPSQPVYAIVAHQFLASDDTKWVACINGLTLAVHQGLVTSGDAGELAANLILIRAINQTMIMSDKKKSILSPEKKSPDEKNLIPATQEKNLPDKEASSGQQDSIFGDTEKSLIPYGRPVRLKDFLEVLTGKKADQIYLGSREDQCLTKNSKRLFKEGIIFFNHLILIRYTPNANDFLEYLHRGVAVQCKPRQPGFDQLFTIYLKPESDTSNSSSLDVKNISFCGIQVKNHKGYIRWTESDKWTTKNAQIEGIQNPYLVILFNLSGKTAKEAKPVRQDDPNRVLVPIHGLESIACLTTEISNALDQLKNADPDLMKMNERNHKTEQWIKSINPHAYRNNTE
ncbi:hypothetical protein VP01_1314g1 [Puccinia sorghi]|uniref:Uncharacterized protein n=1 Tax=Puccinia sorghi TaxID=27349 RepID=A0A0L6VMU5_9BASI|nr:hypothetical protein VP01_1314g1 [Puccinia sorghi]